MSGAPTSGAGASAGGTLKAPFLAFTADEATQLVIQQFAKKHGLPDNCVVSGDAATAAEYLKSHPNPQVLFVDVPTVEAAKPMLDALADVCDPHVKVIVSGRINEYSFYCWLVDIGINNYLLKPFTLPALEGAYAKATQPAGAAPADTVKRGKIISVIGTRGGVGATTIAVNLSWVLANQMKQHVALMDLDPQVGTVAMALDLEPGRGLRDALEKPDRIDSLFLDRVMVKYDEHLSILSAEEPLEEMIISNEAAAEALLNETRAKFSHIIVDVPRQMSPFTRHALKISDYIIVITETTMPGLRDALRLYDYFRDTLKLPTPMFIANREGVAGKYHMKRGDFEKGLNAKLSHVLPFVLEAYASTNAGEVLVETAKSSPVIKIVKEIANQFVDAGATDNNAPAAKNWMNLFKGKKK